MGQGNEFEFIVDEQYENEKGVFTVLSIHRSEMVIRWESGEEIRTDIELQRNIQARREWEVLEKEKAALAAKSGRKSAASRANAVFEGFMDTDFKKSASGTKWRGRNQLGGAVTHKLPDNRYNFNSWAFANKPEMHWLDTAHHKSRSGESRPKFFVRVNPDNMYLGFSIGQPKDDTESSRGWESFTEWLQQEENKDRLHAVALKNELTIYDRNRPEDRYFTAEKDGWKIGGKSDENTTDGIAELISSLIGDSPVSLEVAKTFKKEDAIASGKEISIDISELFSQLIPLYRGSWT